VYRRVDIVASFKFPSVDVRLGANEAPGDAVRVRLRALTNPTPKIPKTAPKIPKSEVVQYKIGVP